MLFFSQDAVVSWTKIAPELLERHSLEVVPESDDLMHLISAGEYMLMSCYSVSILICCMQMLNLYL